MDRSALRASRLVLAFACTTGSLTRVRDFGLVLLHELLGNLDNVAEQALGQVCNHVRQLFFQRAELRARRTFAELLAEDDAEDFLLLRVRGKVVAKKGKGS